MQILFNATSRHGGAELREMVELIGRIDRDREDLDAACAGLSCYRRL